MPRPIRYDLIVMWERFKGFKPRQIQEMMDEPVSIQTIYNYHKRWKEADKTVNNRLAKWAAKANG